MSGNATTDYTSLDVSKRLASAGFKEEYNGRCWIHADNERLAGSFLGYRTANSTENVIADAYRADTLLMWLLERGFFEYIMASVSGEVTVSFNDSVFLTGIIERHANTLPDALAEVAMVVLAKEAEYVQKTD